jgi:hypothetical protein
MHADPAEDTSIGSIGVAGTKNDAASNTPIDRETVPSKKISVF